MSGLMLRITLIAAAITAVFLAGCTTPTPTPAVTPSPTVPPAISPGATPTPAPSTTADVSLEYVIHSKGTYWPPLLPAPGGYLYYVIDVTVRSDKPVAIDGAGFSVEYRRNGTDGLKAYRMNVIDTPTPATANSTSPAIGRLIVTLPEPGPDAYGPVPVYLTPLDQQKGPYKVNTPAYAVMRT